MLWTGIIMVFVALVSATATMYYIADLPADKWEYMQMEQRWANWPDKDCYSKLEVELILNGSNDEQTEKTYIASVASKLVQP